ncbi:hypothetical protein [Microcoleus sp. herbarium5]|uniref:hypothetical protein n=1 Tax=Microcoleus sp. herbarium5 TaxID=3055434 RepID=UPI002FD4C336
MKAAKPKIGVRSQELGVRSQEPGEKRRKEEGRSQKKCFYKYEMLHRDFTPTILQSRLGRTILHEKLAVTAPCDRQPKRVKKCIANH